MKCFLILVIVCAVVGYSEVPVDFKLKYNIQIKKKTNCLILLQGLSSEERKEFFIKVVNDCAKKEGASAQDTSQALQKQAPQTKAGKCIFACIGESLGIVSLKFVSKC